MAGSYFGMGESLAGGIIGLITASKGPQIPSRNVYEETAATRSLREKWGERDWAQNLAEAYRNPAITEAGLTSQLLGGPARTMNLAYSVPKRTSKGTWIDRWLTRTINIPETRGLLNILGEDVLPAMDEMTLASMERQGAGAIGLLSAYGPAARQAYEGTMSPQQLTLRDELLRQVTGQLQAGAGMDPALQREYVQAVRAGQAARGMGLGPTDVYEEAFGVGSAAEARRQARQQAAMQTLSLLQNMEPNVASLLLSGGQLGSAAQLALGSYAPAMAQPAYDPLNPGGYLMDVYDYNANREAANAIAKYNAMMGLSSSLMESGQSTMGGAGMNFGSFLNTGKG